MIPMTRDKIKTLEIKPNKYISISHWHYVTLFNYIDDKYYQAWLYFDGNNWDYSSHKNSYCCFIHRRAMLLNNKVRFLMQFVTGI